MQLGGIGRAQHGLQLLLREIAQISDRVHFSKYLWEVKNKT